MAHIVDSTVITRLQSLMTPGKFWGYIGIMENEMETTIITGFIQESWVWSVQVQVAPLKSVKSAPWTTLRGLRGTKRSLRGPQGSHVRESGSGTALRAFLF